MFVGALCQALHWRRNRDRRKIGMWRMENRIARLPAARRPFRHAGRLILARAAARAAIMGHVAQRHPRAGMGYRRQFVLSARKRSLKCLSYVLIGSIDVIA